MSIHLLVATMKRLNGWQHGSCHLLAHVLLAPAGGVRHFRGQALDSVGVVSDTCVRAQHIREANRKSLGAMQEWHHASLAQLVLLPCVPYLLWAVLYYIKARRAAV